MADADILTASLRANPVFYADSQLVPYGRYSRANPGGQTQYDVNITHPLDVNHKRQARTEVARAARRTVEAQFQDAVRQQVDNLYTAFVDVAAAELTLTFSQTYLKGITRLLEINEELFKNKQISEDPVFALQAQVEQAQLQVREAKQAVSRTTRTLSQMLNIPRDQALAMRIRDKLRDDRPLPAGRGRADPDRDAVAARPERVPPGPAARRGRGRLGQARTALRLLPALPALHAAGQPPVRTQEPALLGPGHHGPDADLQPQPGQHRAGQDQRHPDPGPARPARTLRSRTRSPRPCASSSSASTPCSSRSARCCRPRGRSATRPTAAGKGAQTSVLEFLDAQKDFNDRVKDYRDSLVRHRRAMLDLNTAVGTRLLP